MSAILLGTFEPNTEPWYALRAGGIGASEIASVVGLSPFESAFALWHRKKGNLSGPDPSNPLFYWGHALEPLVAARFAEGHRDEFGVRTTGTYASSEQPWQIANLDRVLVQHDKPDLAASVLEIKTTRYGDNWGPHLSTDIPIHVRCQVMQQMDVMGVPVAWVAVLIGGNDYREYRIDYDAEDARSLREAGAAFWASLSAGDEPPIDCSFATHDAVRELHDGLDPDLDVEIPADLHAAYLLSKDAADTAADEHRQIKSAVLNVMGTARRALVEGTARLRRQPAKGGNFALYQIKDTAV